MPEGYTLWSTTTEGEGGKTIDAGLPNINGTFQGIGGGGFKASGALNVTTSSAQGWGGESGQNRFSLTLNASNSNSIYGNSETVQPPAVKVYMWKRIS